MIKPISHSDTWSIRHQVMWPDKPLKFVQLENDSSGIHFGYYVNQSLVAVVSLFIDKSKESAQFRKFACLNQFQNQGIGSELLEYILRYLTKNGIKQVWCNARLEKAYFYEKFGMQKTKKSFKKNEQIYIIMNKML